MNMFEESLTSEPSEKSIALSKAAQDVVYGKAGMVRICAHYNVLEQSVVQFIIDKTVYETKAEIERARSDIDPDNYGNQ